MDHLRRPLGLMLPGQGSQHVGMATGLYGREPVFTDAVDEVFGLLGPVGKRVKADWLGRDRDIDGVERAQPLLFAVEYGLCQMLESWGASPAVLIGHSVGEFVAATLAGVFTLSDAVRLLWERVELIAAAPPGGMLAVRAGVADLQPYLTDEVVVAAVNAPRQTLLAGPSEPLRTVMARLREAGIYCRLAKATSAFHSPALAAAATAAVPGFEGTPATAPDIRIFSAYTTRPMTPEIAGDAEFWAAQPTTPVLFWPAIEAMLAEGPLLLLEVGPGQGLTALVKTHPSVVSGRSDAMGLLPSRWRDGDDDLRSVRAATARLRAQGYDLHPSTLARSPELSPAASQ